MYILLADKSPQINSDEVFYITKDEKNVYLRTKQDDIILDKTKYETVEAELKRLPEIAEVTNFGLINIKNLISYKYEEKDSKHFYYLVFNSKKEKTLSLDETIVTGLDDSLKTKLEEYGKATGVFLNETKRTSKKTKNTPSDSEIENIPSDGEMDTPSNETTIPSNSEIE